MHITVKGKEIEVTYLGSGRYTEAYAKVPEGGGINYKEVYLFVLPKDQSKRIVSTLNGKKHIPALEYIEPNHSRGEREVFKTEYYSHMDYTSDNYKYYSEIGQAWNKANLKHNWIFESDLFNALFASKVSELNVPVSVKSAINDIACACNRYMSDNPGQFYSIEMQDFNQAVDTEGNIIFMDLPTVVNRVVG